MLKRLIKLYKYTFLPTSKNYSTEASKKTALFEFHTQNKGKMVNFGGFLLPIQYGAENISESHLHTRKKCSLFDVSHMLQTEIRGKDRITFFERICPTDIEGMKTNTSALGLFTDSNTGGILDDLIVTKCEDHLYIVSNASRRINDMNLMLKNQEQMIKEGFEISIKFYETEEKSLIALQGPISANILQGLIENGFNLANMAFMTTATVRIGGIDARITRCGYTGEDGFEISVSSENVEKLAGLLCSQPDVKLAGLGARDTLRLEAGLCLYGNDIDRNTTPVSAVLMWTIGKRRRDLKDFPGANIIMKEFLSGPTTKRVGLISEGRSPPARKGALLFDQDQNVVGSVTSGCPSPSLNANVAMGYVNSNLSKPNTSLTTIVRGLQLPVKVVKLPFIKPGYYSVKT